MRWLLIGLVACAACSGDHTSFSVRESVEQLHVTHARPGATLTVEDAHGQALANGTADTLGSLLFRHLQPGAGYRVRMSGGGITDERSGPERVLSVGESLPPQGFYRDQKLQPGFNYITTRDGTTLSTYVTLPGPVENGPYPTVVNYSGYAPSKPGEPIPSATFLCDQLPVLCDAPNDPSALIAALFGYATVEVNVRGTGCSGGAYDYFETLQLLDGYDVIETVGAQPWVKGHKVGMVGLSYPGITQLFIAAQKPPSLAAIAPLSVIGNSFTTLLAGGMLNDGFALAWVSNVLDGAKPYGQGWEQKRVDGGDTVCAENQLLHGQFIDNVQQARMTQYYDPMLHDRYNPTVWVNQIQVPVFLAGAWQDEQTGPYFYTLLDRFTSSPAQRLNVYNGVHPDGFAPDILNEWHAFLDLFVAERLPVEDPLVRDTSPLLFDRIFGSPLRLQPSKWSSYPDYDAALAAWKAEAPLRSIWERGAGAADDLGAPVATYERSFARWPPPETKAQRLYLHADGTLQGAPPTETVAASSFDLDPAAGERGILAPGGNVWDKLPAYDWKEPQPGKAVLFDSAPLDRDLVMMGTASIDLWLQANVDDADLQVTVSELRPDGQEMYVQSGWLRASLRAPGPNATELDPAPAYLQKDAAPLQPGQWTQVRVGTAGFQHVFRAGSRVRITIDTPGGTRAEWRFSLKPFPSGATYLIGHDAQHASSVALPVLDGLTAQTPLPPCPSLRGQQCRATIAYTNRPAP